MWLSYDSKTSKILGCKRLYEPINANFLQWSFIFFVRVVHPGLVNLISTRLEGFFFFFHIWYKCPHGLGDFGAEMSKFKVTVTSQNIFLAISQQFIWQFWSNLTYKCLKGYIYEVRTFDAQKVRGEVHRDIIIFSKKCLCHYSTPQQWNFTLTGAWRHTTVEPLFYSKMTPFYCDNKFPENFLSTNYL